MSAISEMLSKINRFSDPYLYDYINHYIRDIQDGNKATSSQTQGKKYLTELLKVVDEEIKVLNHYLSLDDISTEDKLAIELQIVDYWNKKHSHDMLKQIKEDESDPDLMKLKVLKDLLEQYQEKSSELTGTRGPIPVGPATTYPLPRKVQMIKEKKNSQYPTGVDYEKGGGGGKSSKRKSKRKSNKKSKRRKSSKRKSSKKRKSRRRR